MRGDLRAGLARSPACDFNPLPSYEGRLPALLYQAMASNKIIRSLCPLQFGHFVRPIRPFCPLYSAILSPLFGQNGRLFYIRNLIRVHCTPDSRWCHHYARACTRVHTRERMALKDAGWRARLAPFRPAVALIGALLRWFLQGFDGDAAKTIARCGSAIGLGEWQKGRFSGVVRLTAIL